MRTQEQKNKAKSLLLNLSAKINEMKSIGMDKKTIISNSNFLIEPIVGFGNALTISKHVQNFLNQTKEPTFAAYFVSIAKANNK